MKIAVRMSLRIKTSLYSIGWQEGGRIQNIPSACLIKMIFFLLPEKEARKTKKTKGSSRSPSVSKLLFMYNLTVVLLKDSRYILPKSTVGNVANKVG